MGKRTKNSKLEELEQALGVFCAREYYRSKNAMTGKRFVLYAVDGGGYDIIDDVVFEVVDGEFTITVATILDEQYKRLESKTFKFKLVEDE